MRLAGAGAARFCDVPDLAMKGALLHGPDAGLIALRRQALVRAVTEGEDMRLSQIEPGALRSDPAALETDLKSRGFFPGRRLVLIDEARDGLAALIETGLDAADEEDAFLLVTATGLAARSRLRKLFEGRRDVVSAAFYPDAPDAAEVAQELEASGISVRLGPEIEAYLAGVAADMDPGSFHQLIEKLSVFMIDRGEAPDFETVVALCPASGDPDLDALIDAVADGRPDLVGRLVGKVMAAGGSAVRILMLLGRHFRVLLGLLTAEDGVEAAIGRVRPPVFGPRRARVSRQARVWTGRIEPAMRVIFEAERQLRSAGERPERAIAERCLIRLSMMAAQGR